MLSNDSHTKFVVRFPSIEKTESIGSNWRKPNPAITKIPIHSMDHKCGTRVELRLRRTTSRRSSNLHTLFVSLSRARCLVTSHWLKPLTKRKLNNSIKTKLTIRRMFLHTYLQHFQHLPVNDVQRCKSPKMPFTKLKFAALRWRISTKAFGSNFELQKAP